MAEASFEVDLIDETTGKVLLSVVPFTEEQFREIKQANERGTLKARTFIAETTRREV